MTSGRNWAASSAAGASASVELPLGHAGRWITDDQGRVVVLHGLNMVYKRPPYAPDAIGFGDDDAAFLAREGFNAVRVGVIYKAVEPINIAGLSNPHRRNWYPVDANDLLNSAAKLQSTKHEISQLLDRSGFWKSATDHS